MKPIYCLNKTRNRQLCTQMLCKIGDDFTGVIEIKCPRCKTITTARIREGRVNA